MVIIVERMFTSLILLLSFVFAFPSYAQTPTQLRPLYKETVPEAALKQYQLLPYKFIDLIKAIPKPLPASLDSFQKIFNNQLHITERDEDYIRYTTGSFRTLDGVIIKKVGVGVRVRAKDKVRGFGIYLDPKQCVSTRLLKKEFGFLIPELLSIHPVPNAPIAYYTADEWGKFDMGSTMDYPDCATGVGVSVFSDKQEKKEWIKYVREQAPHLRERERQRALDGK